MYPLDPRIARLLQKLSAIADARDADDLEDVRELVSSRGGRTLLTLGDAYAARDVQRGLGYGGEVRGDLGPPEWTFRKNFEILWSEDDATSSASTGHENLSAAWRRLFPQESEIPKAILTWDAGDAVFKLLPAGRVVVASYPGNSEIRRLLTSYLKIFASSLYGKFGGPEGSQK